jgi:hypothetical protein
MSQLEVNKVLPQSGTTLTLGESGDTITIPSGATLDASSGTLTLPDDSVTTAKIDDGAVTTVKIADANITTAKLADANITTAKLAYDPNPFRNIVINGNMQIAQRATSKAGVGFEYATMDRWQTVNGNLGTWTQSQSTDVPTGQGFATSLKMDCTTADATPAAGDEIYIRQLFEGQNLQYLKKGTANASSLTASFWIKSTKTGIFIVELVDDDNSRSISKSYTVNVTNTWEYKTITFPGDTTGAFTNDNGQSLNLNFWIATGSDASSGTLQTTWGTTVTANRAVGQVNCADSTSNDWYITGVQLEAGSQASGFEFLPIDVNLGRCQRYFQLIASGDGKGICMAANYSSGEILGMLNFPVSMRTTPTISQVTGADYYKFYRNSGNDGFNSFNLNFTQVPQSLSWNNGSEISGTAGDAGQVATGNAASFLAVTAEL